VRKCGEFCEPRLCARGERIAASAGAFAEALAEGRIVVKAGHWVAVERRER
jgi:hypothetical protein